MVPMCHVLQVLRAPTVPRRRYTAAVRSVPGVAESERNGRGRRLAGLLGSRIGRLLGRRPGGRTGAPDVAYGPRADGRPDSGEVVWTWVPYDEGDGRGKDRPVLVIGRRGAELLGLLLSSQDHDRDAADEARHGRVWTDIGSGAWDSRGRPSEVRLDRLLVLDPAAVRREGAALDRARFDRVVADARRVQGW
jgi:hypothetical protein